MYFVDAEFCYLDDSLYFGIKTNIQGVLLWSRRSSLLCIKF